MSETSPQGAHRPTGLAPVDVNALHLLLVQNVRDYGLFVLDTRGHVASWNVGAERIKGYKAHEIIGRHFSAFYPEADKRARKPDRELEIATAEGRFEEEGWRVRKDGTQFWANVVITALRNDEGTLVGFAKVTRDLTERRQSQERALADARRVAEAEVANRAKSEFLAAMSHELRTPLNAIGGFAELLEVGVGGPLNERQQEYVSRIRSSQRHLLGIITDLLNYSRIEAGQVTYDLADVDVREIVRDVIPLMEPQAEARGITLTQDGVGGALLARADRTKTEQIVLNLLSNAVKFTARGGRVSVACAGDADRVTIAVCDTGTGIAADKLEAIFEPFVQVGRTLATPHEGTGLGLAISRDLARGMGGDLTVRSAPGAGSTFTVVLPRR